MYRILHQPTSLAYYNRFDKKDGNNINNQKEDEKKDKKMWKLEPTGSP
jgi:hypothetical protein